MSNINIETENAEGAPDFSKIAAFELETVSPEIVARSRKNHTVILQSINAVTGTVIAEMMGVHESAVSRFKSQGGLAFAARLLASAGLKVVPVDAVVFVQPDDFK